MRAFEHVGSISILIAAIGATSVAAGRAFQSPQAVSVFCAGSDRTIKVPLAGGACAPGERQVGLPGPSQGGDKDSPDARLRLLEMRVKELEAALVKGSDLGTIVRAPFDVVDSGGNRIFRVGKLSNGNTNGAFVFNGAEKVVALMTAGPGGGIVRAISDGGDLSVGLGAGAAVDGPALVIRENEKVRVQVGMSPLKRYAVRVNDSTEKPLAALGESQAGTGAMGVYDKAGVVRASLQFLTDGRSMLGVRNAGGELLASLSQGDSGGGKLQLTDPGGEPMVEAGFGDGVGIVRTGPLGRARTMLTPGTFIKGRK